MAAAKKKYSFSLKPNEGKVRVKVEFSGVVEVVDPTWVSSFLQDLPVFADDYDISIISLEAKEQ